MLFNTLNGTGTLGGQCCVSLSHWPFVFTHFPPITTVDSEAQTF
jgi:hypothetical protein